MANRENIVAGEIVDAAYRVHRRLGPGLLESVYQKAFGIELARKGLDFETEVRVPVVYDGVALGLSVRVDVIVEGAVLVELKATEFTNPIYKQQVLTYLRVTGLRLGLLANFGFPTIKKGLTRVVNGLPD